MGLFDVGSEGGEICLWPWWYGSGFQLGFQGNWLMSRLENERGWGEYRVCVFTVYARNISKSRKLCHEKL